MLTVRKSSHFHAAHLLTDHCGECRHLHGHTYRVTVEVSSPAETTSDMVIDFNDLKKILNELVETPFDHAFIYDVTSPEECEIAEFLKQRSMKVAPLPCRTTAENLARHIYNLISKRITVAAVIIHESDDSRAEYRQTTA